MPSPAARPPAPQPPRPRGNGLALIVAGQLFLLCLGLALCLGGEGAPGLPPGPPLAGALWGLTGTALLIGLALALERRFPGPMAEADRELADHLRATGVRLTPGAILLLSALAGVSEEIVFRVALIDRAMAGWPAPLAAVASAALFGLAHPLSVFHCLVAALIGVVLAALYLVSDGLLAPVIAHALYDVWALRDLARKMALAERGGSDSTLAA